MGVGSGAGLSNGALISSDPGEENVARGFGMTCALARDFEVVIQAGRRMPTVKGDRRDDEAVTALQKTKRCGSTARRRWLRRAVGAARHKARAMLTQRMAERLSAPMRDRLDALVAVGDEHPHSPLHGIKTGTSSPSFGGMNDLLTRLESIEATSVLDIDVSWVNGNYQRILFHSVRTASADRVHEMAAPRRHRIAARSRRRRRRVASPTVHRAGGLRWDDLDPSSERLSPINGGSVNEVRPVNTGLSRQLPTLWTSPRRQSRPGGRDSSTEGRPPPGAPPPGAPPSDTICRDAQVESAGEDGEGRSVDAGFVAGRRVISMGPWPRMGHTAPALGRPQPLGSLGMRYTR